MKHDFNSLLSIISTLRGENGCPWDKEQTLYSMKDNLIEEAFETIEALDNKDIPNICEEFGDLLLHVTLHSQIASEDGLFDINDVINGICEKLIRRHPHVFGNTKVSTSQEVVVKWDEIKKLEKPQDAKSSSILHKVGKGLPSTIKAHKLQEKVAKVGFDWETADAVLVKVHEEISELNDACKNNDIDNIKEEIGDNMFVLVNLARHYGLSADEALRMSNEKFIKRFQYIENKLQQENIALKDATLDKMESYWQESKKEEKR